MSLLGGGTKGFTVPLYVGLSSLYGNPVVFVTESVWLLLDLW